MRSLGDIIYDMSYKGKCKGKHKEGIQASPAERSKAKLKWRAIPQCKELRYDDSGTWVRCPGVMRRTATHGWRKCDIDTCDGLLSSIV